MTPSRIKVGPHTYTVHISQQAIDSASRRERSDLYGYTEHGPLRMSITPDLAPTKSREVMLHETLHCITELCGVTADLGSEQEEKLVDRIAPELLDTLRRNPALVAYLLE